MSEQQEIRPARLPMSLEKKLPLMMSAVLLMILAVGVTLAYREVSRAAEDIAQQRMKQVSNQLSDLIAGGQPRIGTLLGSVAADPAVIELLRERSPSRATRAKANAALAKVVPPADSGVGAALFDIDGRVVLSTKTPDMGQQWIEGAVPDFPAPVSKTISTTPFYLSNGRIYYSTTLPIIVDGVRIGAVSQNRRLNASARTEKDIAGLTGQDVGILLHNADGSQWVTLGGKPVPPPNRRQAVRGMRTYVHESARFSDRVLITESPVKGIPWVVTLELPLSAIVAGPRAMLNQFLVFSFALLIIGALAMWLIGRRMTAPLATLTRAAEAIAGGDYSQRVDSAGDREIAQLAETFNRMARGTARAHRDLEDRFREARSLAEELEHANSRLRATGRAAEEAQLAAETANAAKSSFLAAMSHELRTPLNAIAGYVQLIQMGLRGPVTPEQQADLHRIKRSHAYLLGLIEDVLNFAKLDAHQMEFHARHVAVDEIMRDAETLLAPQLKASGINYSYEECDSGLAVCADPDKTQQILVNLLTNAVKFTRPPGNVTVSCASDDKFVRIMVSDTGIGIKAGDVDRVFEPFVQLGRGLSQPGEGVGLGLTISRDFARRMGGDLTVTSTPGEGSQFTLALPRSESREDEGGEMRSTEAAGAV
ncbi:MAG TPA: ATP-binding protein [Gemmatimonadaceae bacterium]|nr:ATP-binding protein [Gemmatimonadaceae bacterium]